MGIFTRALHQFAVVRAEPSVFNPEAILSKYGFNKLTPAKVCRIITEQKDSAEAFTFFDWAPHQRGYKHNGSVYGAIIHSLCVGKRFDLLEKILMDLKKEKFALSAPTFSFMLKTMGQEGKIQETLQLFHRMAEFRCEPTLSVYRSVLCVLVEVGSLDEVLIVFQEMLDGKVVPDSLTLGMLTNAFCKRGRPDDALMLAETVPKSVDDLTLNGLVRSLCKVARPYDAIRLIERARDSNLRPNLVTYEKLIHSLCRIEKVDDSITILEKMSGESLTPGISTFDTVLDHLCKFVRVDEAYQLFQRLPVEPDSVSFKIMVNGFCKKRMVDKAHDLIIEMANRGFIPSLDMYSWIAKRLISLGRVEETYQLLLSLEGKGLVLDRSFLNGIIEAMCERGYMNMVQRLIEQKSDFSPDKCTFEAVINGFCEGKQYLEAVRYIRERVLKSGCVQDIDDWSPLFTGLLEGGHFDETMKLYQSLLEQECVFNKFTLNIILRALSKAGRILDVKRFISDMQKSNISVDRQTYEFLIDSKFQENVEAVELFKPLIGGNIILSKEKYTMLIENLVKSGALEFAVTVFHEMRRVGCLPNTGTYNALIGGLCDADNPLEARRFLQKMKEDGYVGETATYAMLLCKYLKMGQYDEVDSLYEEMRTGGIRPDAASYNALLEGFSRTNKVEELLQLLDEMRVHGCPPSQSGVGSLLKNLGSRHTKRVEKYVKELFGIVLTVEASKTKEVVQESKKSSLPFLDSFTRSKKTFHTN